MYQIIKTILIRVIYGFRILKFYPRGGTLSKGLMVSGATPVFKQFICVKQFLIFLRKKKAKKPCVISILQKNASLVFYV